MNIEPLVVAACFGLDTNRLVMGNILQRLAGFGHKFLDLIQIDFAIGVDGRLSVRLAIKHILINVGIEFDVTALGLDTSVIDVEAVLVFVNCSAGVLDL